MIHVIFGFVAVVGSVFATVRNALEPIREAARPVTTPAKRAVERHDALKVLLTLLAVYLLFVVLVWNQNPGSRANSIASTLQVVTFLGAAYALLALALNLQWGYTGLFNIGVAGFMAVGVYTMGIVTRTPDPSVAGAPPGLGLPLWVGVIAGMVVASLLGLFAALPALRLRADYFAIVTLGLSEIVRLTLQSAAFDSLLRDTLGVGTGGGSGMGLSPGMDDPIRELFLLDGNVNEATELGSVFLTEVNNQLVYIPPLLGSEHAIRATVFVNWMYVLFLGGAVVLVYLFLSRIGRSPFGRVLKAIREDELVANSLGKNVDLVKIKVFMIGCALMGLGGILWQGSQGYVSPTPQFMPVITFYIFVALMVGGSGSNTGSVLGGIVFAGLLFEGPRRVGPLIRSRAGDGQVPNHFAEAVGSADLSSFLLYFSDNIAPVQFVLLGLVLIVLMHRKPEGILGHRVEEAAAVDLSERASPGGDGE